MSLFRKKWWLTGMAAGAIAATMLAAACGGDDDDDDDTGETPGATSQAGGIDYSKLDGEVSVDGSSTVFPISEAVAEEFTKVARGVQTKVALSGTGGGFEKFCRQEIDVSDASRPINQKEKDACASAGIPNSDIVELQVAIDALTVVG